MELQRSAKVFVRGCEKFVIALAYLFCLALVGSCLAKFAYFLADLCIGNKRDQRCSWIEHGTDTLVASPLSVLCRDSRHGR